MKKLLIIGSTLIAFTAVSFMSSNNGNVYAKNSVASLDTLPKRDSMHKKKDSITLAYVSNTYVLDTVPKKDSTKKRDSITLAYAGSSYAAGIDTTPKKEDKKKDSINVNSFASNSFFASLDTVPKKEDKKKDSLFLAIR